MTKSQMRQLRMQIAGWGSLCVALSTIHTALIFLFCLMSIASFSVDIYLMKKEQS